MFFVGGFAHGPAQGFQQIGFSAAIWTDHACQSPLDNQFGGFHKGFKSQQAQARNMQSPNPPRSGLQHYLQRFKPVTDRSRRLI